MAVSSHLVGASETDSFHPDVDLQSTPEVTCLISSCCFFLGINRIYATTPDMEISSERSTSHNVSIWAPEVNGCLENLCK